MKDLDFSSILKNLPSWGLFYDEFSRVILHKNEAFKKLFSAETADIDSFFDTYSKSSALNELETMGGAVITFFTSGNTVRYFNLILIKGLEEKINLLITVNDTAHINCIDDLNLRKSRCSSCEQGLLIAESEGRIREYNAAFESLIPFSIPSSLQDFYNSVKNKWNLNLESICNLMKESLSHHDVNFTDSTGHMYNLAITRLVSQNSQSVFAFHLSKVRETPSNQPLVDFTSDHDSETLIDLIPDFVHVIDRNLNITFANIALKKLCIDFGIPSSIEDLNLFEAMPFFDQETGKKYLDVFKSGETLNTEEVISLKGTRKFVKNSRIPFLKDGKVEKILSIITDITPYHDRQVQAISHSDRLALVAELGASLLTDDLSDDYFINRIADGFVKLMGRGYAAVSIYDDETEEVEIKAISGLQKVLSIIVPILGQSPIGMKVKIPEDFRTRLKKGQLFRLPGGLFESLIGSVPQYLCSLIEKLLHIKSVVNTGLTFGDRFLGTLVLFLDDESVYDEKVIVQYINITTLALIRSLEQKNNQRFSNLMQKNQRIENLGMLAAGIAHDFNNLITTIQGNAQLLRLDCQNHENIDQIDDIIISAEKASDLTKQLLTYSSHTIASREIFCGKDRLAGLKSILRRTIEEPVNIEFQLCSSPCMVKMDPVSFDQIILSLVINARETCGNKGRITVSCNYWPSENPISHSGKWCSFSVTDNGNPIEPEDRSRLFSASYQMENPKDKPTVNLATIKVIVESSQGIVRHEATIGRGNTFTFYLPAFSSEAHTSPLSDRTPSEIKILVVEDEKIVLSIAEKMLIKAGYETTGCESGESALRLIADGYRPDIVITDVIMPGMSGYELLAKINEFCNPLLIFTSGYPEDILKNHGIDIDAGNFLVKPYSNEELLGAVLKITGK
ncbi:response regulator [Myxococcota bacterium]|nr:response regulator [Myxococcota bacterium]MBU1381353.1 response regulator [Myxococcota bacterium]MBU1495973.1 response regulator [Myxococcota bacterium]